MTLIKSRKKPVGLSVPSEIWTICLLSVFLIAPLLTVDWIMMGESIDQLVRAIEAAWGFSEGIFYPRWLGDMAGGFGCPYFVFYAPLIFTVSALFNLVGLGIIASVKCMLILGIFLAGIGVFLRTIFPGNLWRRRIGCRLCVPSIPHR